MIEFTQYYGRFADLRGGLGGLPAWARGIVGIVAIPGIILVGLSVVAFVVSVMTLLLLTVPIYSLLRQVCIPRSSRIDPLTGAKRIEVTVVK